MPLETSSLLKQQTRNSEIRNFQFHLQRVRNIDFTAPYTHNSETWTKLKTNSLLRAVRNCTSCRGRTALGNIRSGEWLFWLCWMVTADHYEVTGDPHGSSGFLSRPPQVSQLSHSCCGRGGDNVKRFEALLSDKGHKPCRGRFI